MSEFSDAFADVQGEADDLLGTPQKIKIDGVEYSALIGEVSFDELVMAGGDGDQGGFTAQVAIALLPEQPAGLVSVEARGSVCDLLTITNINGVVWLLTCGHVASEE